MWGREKKALMESRQFFFLNIYSRVRDKHRLKKLYFFDRVYLIRRKNDIKVYVPLEILFKWDGKKKFGHNNHHKGQIILQFFSPLIWT